MIPKKWNIDRDNFIVLLVTTYCHHTFNMVIHHSFCLTCDPNPITIVMTKSLIVHHTCDGNFIELSLNLWWIKCKKLLLSKPQWTIIPSSSNCGHKWNEKKIPSLMDCGPKLDGLWSQVWEILHCNCSEYEIFFLF